jgi:signal transduction histidine kinase
VRLRLTLLYGALFLVSGAVLLTVTYVLVRHSTSGLLLLRNGPSGPKLTATSTVVGTDPGGIDQFPSPVRDLARTLSAQAARQHAAEMHQLVIQSCVALAIMAALSIFLGWLVAGRVLRPLRAMTTAARRISAHNLHERLAVTGPRDELSDLADTLDSLLSRLEGAFEAQRRFVANAAHELRTPLTLERALLEEALTDPDPTLATFQATSRRLLAVSRGQEHLLEALLTLASSERGLDRREPFDLSALVGRALAADGGRPRLRIRTDIAPAPATGDARLAERLVANLMDNAVHHNRPGGHVEASTGTAAGRAFLSVSNTGPVIPPGQINRLFEPFRRLAADRTAIDDNHHGLGLSIVRAIAVAHGATVTAVPRAGGGLTMTVSFPPPEPAVTSSDPDTALDRPPDDHRSSGRGAMRARRHRGG